MNVDEMVSVVSLNKNFKVRQLKSGYDLFYENKLTGVYFMMGYSPEDEAPQFPGFEKSGLFVHLNYARPTYFAKEAIPIISSIAERLSLFVLDNQFSSETKTPSKPDAKALTDSWMKSNKWGVEAGWTHGEPIYFLPRQQLDYMWNYLTLTDSLQQGTELFVPTKLFAFKDKSNRVQTCCAWPNYMPQVFPFVDLVLVGVTPAPPGQGLKGFASLTKIREMLSSRITQLKEPLEYLLLSEELPSETRKALDQVPLIPLKDLSAVAWDQIVDVPPPSVAVK